MACNQSQIKRFPWTPERVASLWSDAKANFVDRGITEFNDVVDGLSAKYNLQREIIVKGLSEPKSVSRRLTDEMWVKQQNRRLIEQQARHMIANMDTNAWQRGAHYISEVPRRVTLFGHFGAFTKSHLSDQLFYNPVEYAKNFQRSWALATKHGKAMHEKRLAETFTDTDPDYILAKRTGLDVKLGGGVSGSFAKETVESTGQRKGHGRSAMAYDELRMTRFRIFKKELKRLTPEERADMAQVKALSNVLNGDTGTVAHSNLVTRFLFLAPRLFPAQLKHTFIDIPKSLFETGLGFNYQNASQASRYVARKAAILASAQTAILAAETAYAKLTGDERFMPNLGDPTRTNWLRPKIFGYSIPISPTVELMKVPVQMIAAGRAARAGDNKTLAALSRGLKTVIGRQNPLFELIEETILGQEPGTGRPTPFPGLVGRTKETKMQKRISYPEYATSKLPIPLSTYFHDLFTEMKDHGMTASDIGVWLHALKTAVPAAITSYHISKTYPPREKEIVLKSFKDLPSLESRMKSREQKLLRKTLR